MYNAEKFVSQSIESVLNQTYSDIEVIAVDDGSTDCSLEVLKKYSDKIVIVSQENQGLSPALNAGISKAKGRWLKWFSPDDVMYPEAITTLVEEAKKLPEKTILYSNWELIDENNKVLRSFSESNYNDLSSFNYNVRLLDGQQINVNTSLIPLSLIKECEIRQLEDPVAIDYDFFLRIGIIHNVKFYLIEQTLIKYRIHSSQLSRKNIINTLTFLEELRSNTLSEIDNKNKKRYVKELENYKKKKSISKKTLELGLKLSSLVLPNWVTNRLLIFYVNSMRKAR